MKNALFVVVPILALSACQSGLGRLPSVVVELYDQVTPSGGMEIEAGRDGSILEIEAEIAPSDLPARVRAAALEKAPGGTVIGAEREVNASGRHWEVKLRHEGRVWEFVVDNTGRVLETEKELRRSEAPPAVLAAADAAITGGTFKSVEVIERGAHQEYHVKKSRDGASYKVVVSSTGQVLRKVREASCEIEIPLR